MSKNQSIMSQLVAREVVQCASTMVHELANHPSGAWIDEIMEISVGQDWGEAIRESADVQIVESDDGNEFAVESGKQFYVARFNLPGCLPNDVSVFDDISDAWESLAESYESSGDDHCEDFAEKLRSMDSEGMLTGPDGMDYVVAETDASQCCDEELESFGAMPVNDDDECREACDEFGIEPIEHEAYEHWIVTEWFGSKLAEHGEIVGEFMGFTIWGRCTTGQAISMDGVIAEIAESMGILEGQEHEWSV